MHRANTAGGKHLLFVVELGPQGVGVGAAGQQVVHNLNTPIAGVAAAICRGEFHVGHVADFFGPAENAVHIALAEREAHIDGVHLRDGGQHLTLGDVVALGELAAANAACDFCADGAVFQIFFGLDQVGLGFNLLGFQPFKASQGALYIFNRGRVALSQGTQAFVVVVGVDNLRVDFFERGLRLLKGGFVADGVDFKEHVPLVHNTSLLVFGLEQKALYGGFYLHLADGFYMPNAPPKNHV